VESEIWRSIPGCNGRYEASSFGRIRSIIDTNRPRILKPTRSLWGTRPNTDYLKVGLYIEPKKRVWRYVHRLVLFAFVGAPDDPKADACHNDGDSMNNRIENLRWDTRSNNLKEAHGGEADCTEAEEAMAVRLEASGLLKPVFDSSEDVPF